MNPKLTIKYLIQTTTIVVIMLFGTFQSNATHIVGGDMTYRALGNNFFEVNLTLRRDCFNGSPEAQFDNEAIVAIFRPVGGLDITVGLNGRLLIPFMGDDTLNTTFMSDCGFIGSQICVQEATYTDTIFLPYKEEGYILAYQRCCRNITLNNILEPLDTGSTYHIVIPGIALELQNSSPVFNKWHEIYICSNEELTFDHGATDADGDSLVYSLCTPSQGASEAFPMPFTPSSPPFDTVVWAPGFSLENMMGGTPLTIDSETGEFYAIPNQVGQFLIGVCVEEYRDGELIGTVRRDFEYNVRACSTPPDVSFLPTETTCDGNLTIDFVNTSVSVDSFLWFFDWPSEDPAFMSSEMTPSFTYPALGQYTVRLVGVRKADGCSAEVFQEVSIYDSQLQADFTFVLDECADGNQTLSISLINKAVEPDPNFDIESYSWTITQAGQPVQVSTDPIFNTTIPNSDITVQLVVTSETGCTAEVIRDVIIDEIFPVSDFAYELDGCSDGETANVSFMDLSAGLNTDYVPDTWSWTITTNEGDQFFDTESFVATINQNSSVTATMDVIFDNGCVNDVVKSFDMSELLPNAAYIYTQVLCNSPDSVDILFEDTSAPLNPGLAITGYNWEVLVAGQLDVFNTASFTVTIPKDEVVMLLHEVTFENGCVATNNDSFTPGPYATLEIIADPLILCNGATSEIIANPNSDWTYTWEPTEGLEFGNDMSNPIANPAESTTYCVTVSDGICSEEACVEVLVLDQFDLTVTGDSLTCDGSFELEVTGGEGVGEYNWSDMPDMSNILGTGPTFSGMFTGDEATYYAQFIGGICPSEIQSFNLFLFDLDLDFAEPYSLCRGDTIGYPVFNLDPDQMVTFEWMEDEHIVSGGNSSEPIIGIGLDEDDPFELIFTATNQIGCTQTDTVSFEIIDNPVIDFESTLEECGLFTVCFEISGDYNGFPSWDFGDPTVTTDISLEPSPCYTYPVAGTYTVTLANLSGFCPADSVFHDVTVNDPIEIELPEQIVYCTGDDVTIDAMSNVEGLTYYWCNAAGDTIHIGSEITYTPTGDETLTVKGEDVNGCEASASVSLVEFIFDYSVDVPSVLCDGQETMLSVMANSGGNYTYQWGPEDCIISGGDTDSPIFVATEDKVITLIVTDVENGCTEESSYPITLGGLVVEAAADPDAEIYLGEEVDIFVVDPNPDETFEWDNGSMEAVQTVAPLETTTYTVTVTDTDGCTGVASVTITVIQPQCDEDDVFLPNAFSPNGDNVNDVWMVRSNFLEELELIVYDRWGEEVFITTDIKGAWDGTFNGEELSSDVYAYYMNALCVNGERFKKMGNVSLLR